MSGPVKRHGGGSERAGRPVPGDDAADREIAMSYESEIHRFTCRRCGQTFTGRPMTTDSWNAYALHSYECTGKGSVGYEHDVIDTRPFDPVVQTPPWSPYG